MNEKLVYLKLRAIDIKIKEIREIARRIGMVPKYIYRYYCFAISILFQPEEVTIVDVVYNISCLDDVVDLLCKKLSMKINHVGTNFN